MQLFIRNFISFNCPILLLLAFVRRYSVIFLSITIFRQLATSFLLTFLKVLPFQARTY